jgi:hypothetical protein
MGPKKDILTGSGSLSSLRLKAPLKLQTGRNQKLTPVILAAQEAKIRRIAV